jgi:hypothetical protein
MIVYRVENRMGTGPYSRCINLPSYLTVPERHPTPSQDGLSSWYNGTDYAKMNEYYFGFESLEQLKSWFTGAFEEEFSEHNYNMGEGESSKYAYGISCYDVPDEDVEIGDSQLVFLRDNAQLLRFDAYEPVIMAVE